MKKILLLFYFLYVPTTCLASYINTEECYDYLLRNKALFKDNRSQQFQYEILLIYKENILREVRFIPNFNIKRFNLYLHTDRDKFLFSKDIEENYFFSNKVSDGLGDVLINFSSHITISNIYNIKDHMHHKLQNLNTVEFEKTCINKS